MTDKDNYDYCAHCDVEPPALKFKCPECKHNPDKEQIMIDGVDVSKCSRLIVNQLYGYICNCEEDMHLISSCKNRPNCHFKQLARKEQECEELKEELETYKRILNNPEHRIALTDIRTGEREVWQELGSKADRYRKALEEIEEVCLEDTRTLADGTQVRYDSLDEILDIINKAKGTN